MTKLFLLIMADAKNKKKASKKKVVNKKPLKKKAVNKKIVRKNKPKLKKTSKVLKEPKAKLKKIRPEPIITIEHKGGTKIISGVSQSISNTLGIDVNIVRIGFILSFIFLIGIPIYFLLSIIMKD